MKKYLPYVVVVMALAAIVAIYFLKEEQEEKVPDDQAFTVKDTDKIHRIFLVDKGGKKANLERKDDHWVVNDKYKVMPPKIETLLSTLKHMRVYYPVAKAARNNVIKSLATESIKVELYEEGAKKPFKVFFVGNSTLDGNGTYMIMSHNGKTAENPYVVYIPGFVGFLTPRFIVEEKEWRDTNVFDYEMEEISEVKMEYLKEPEKSFHIQVVNQDSFLVDPLNSELSTLNQKVKKQHVITYLSFFEKLNVEGFANQSRRKDSLAKEMPYAILSVKTKDGEERSIEVHRMPLNKRSKLQFDEFGEQVPYDLDRYYAFINEGKDFVVIQHFVFGKVFREYQEFLTVE